MDEHDQFIPIERPRALSRLIHEFEICIVWPAQSLKFDWIMPRLRDLGKPYAIEIATRGSHGSWQIYFLSECCIRDGLTPSPQTSFTSLG
jgi:hypothetical protein